MHTHPELLDKERDALVQHMCITGQDYLGPWCTGGTG
eukprot:COSAG01_NODE_25306_length_749_cov_1.786154_1_plen_36_part_10